MPVNKTEKLLQLCADTVKMPGWNDSLERMTDSVLNKCLSNLLSDDEFEMVAGGQRPMDSTMLNNNK